MSNQQIALRLALEALENSIDLVSHEARNAEALYGRHPSRLARIQGLVAFEVAHEKAITALQEALAEQPAPVQEPEFFTHNVEQPYDWSEWVCPDPKSYLMKCCDCGLVHEAEFGVVRYKSETEREDCEPVDDPNLQAVFRMRRSEQWSPADTAHRAGGLPMEQPAQQCKWPTCQSEEYQQALAQEVERELVGEQLAPVQHQPCKGTNCGITNTHQQHSVECIAEHDAASGTLNTAGNRHPEYRYAGYKNQPLKDGCTADQEAAYLEGRLAQQPAQRKPLSVEKMFEAIRPLYSSDKTAWLAVNHSKDEYRAIEAALGIKENT